MNTLLLPDVEDLESVVDDYFDSLMPTRRLDEERHLIIQRSIPAFAQLIRLIQSAGANGQAEEILLIAFMRDLALAGAARSTESHDKSEHTLQYVLH